RRAESVHVDGGASVHPRDLLEFIRCVVFLAVPQWGTNIADWVRARAVSREIVVAEMRTSVAGAQVFLLARLEEQLDGGFASLTGAQLLLAVQDALREANERNGDRSAMRIAEAHEAASELALYLRQMASDFRAIDDLSSERPPRGPLSPAHFND